MNTPAPMTISDREIALKLADLTADNKDGFGFAFYNASLVRFAIEIAKWRDEQWSKANLSFAQRHPANPNAKCKCEHWESCKECHPTAHTENSNAAITALRTALAEPVQEPISLNDGRVTMYPDGSIGVGTPSGIDAAHGITGERK